MYGMPTLNKYICDQSSHRAFSQSAKVEKYIQDTIFSTCVLLNKLINDIIIVIYYVKMHFCHEINILNGLFVLI